MTPYRAAPSTQASTPFWACNRFSASSNTTDCGPSITSASTSSPRWAGRQCMNTASAAAFAISAFVTRYGASMLCRLSFGSSDIDTQVSVTTQRAPATAFSGSSVSSIRPPWARAQSTNSLGGRNASGVARRKVKPKRTAASIQLRATLLPSPRHDLAGDRAATLLERHDVGHQLTGVRCLRQAVDHRHGRVLRHLVQLGGAVGAQHDRVHVARQDTRGVGDRLAPAKLGFLAGQHDHLTAKLAHPDLERDAGARRGFLEDQRQGLARQRTRGHAAGPLEPGHDVQHLPQRRAVEVAQIEEVPGTGHLVGGPALDLTRAPERRAHCAAAGVLAAAHLAAARRSIATAW